MGGNYYFGGDSVNTGDIAETNIEDNENIDKTGKNVIIYAGIDINPKKNPYIINLFRNGKKIFLSKNADLVYEIKPALDIPSFYRVEIDVYFGRKKITYLYSNNIEIY